MDETLRFWVDCSNEEADAEREVEDDMVAP
jgi:hypothetical protein